MLLVNSQSWEPLLDIRHEWISSLRIVPFSFQTNECIIFANAYKFLPEPEGYAWEWICQITYKLKYLYTWLEKYISSCSKFKFSLYDWL